MQKTYVKKIWTLNPTGYKYMPIEEAIHKYAEYIVYWTLSASRRGVDLKTYKTFKQWLATEI